MKNTKEKIHASLILEMKKLQKKYAGDKQRVKIHFHYMHKIYISVPPICLIEFCSAMS